MVEAVNSVQLGGSADGSRRAARQVIEWLEGKQ